MPTEKAMGRALAYVVVGCLMVLAFLVTLGLGIRLIEWALA